MTTTVNAPVGEIDKTNYRYVSPKDIVVDETENPREDYGNIEELMNSIVENGIKTPLKVYLKDDKAILKNGFRRMRAIHLAIEKGKMIERVPVIFEASKLNEEERTLEHIIFNDGKPLTMIEQAEVIRRLMNIGWKVTDVVKRTGKARGYIENLILLNKTPMKVQNHIREGKISAHAVIQITQAARGNEEQVIKDVEEAITAAQAAGKEKATPKHVGTKEVKNQSFGKFYKWVEEIADHIAGRKEVIRERDEVITKMLVYFENGRSPKQVAEEYFIAKAPVGIPTEKTVGPKVPVPPVTNASAKKAIENKEGSKKKFAKKVTPKKAVMKTNKKKKK